MPPKTVIPTVPSVGPTSSTLDPAVRRTLQILTDAHNARNGATDRRFVTEAELSAQKATTTETTSADNTSELADQIATLMEMITSLQSAVIALQSHSTSDGYDVGNGEGQIPVSNGILCANLNAGKVGGTGVAELLIGGATVTGKTDSGNYLTVTLNGVTHYLKLYA